MSQQPDDAPMQLVEFFRVLGDQEVSLLRVV